MEDLWQILWLLIIGYFLYKLFFPSQPGDNRETYEEYRSPEEEQIFGNEGKFQPNELSIESLDDKFSEYTGTKFIDTTGDSPEKDKGEITLKSPGIKEETIEEQGFNFLLDHDEIRRGFIIGEILSKPKSGRKD